MSDSIPGDVAPASVRVRFCPSPTGTPHVGLVRTALFNWAWARHTGGTFVFRIEDTDAARDSEESYALLVETMRWLGLDWDEGVEVGGPHEPYRQSQRADIYEDAITRLREAGYLYESFSTPEEIEARHVAAGRDPKLGYDGFDRELSEEQVAAFRAEGREPTLRFRMPGEDITFTDLIRGEITFSAQAVPDFVVVRANGRPLYTLVNPVDDALMDITHVLRGEDLLSSTPRQVALHRALVDVGLSKRVPEFGHLPYVMGQGNKKLSKRDPESNLFLHRERGMIPEGILNYLALLGWSIAPDNDLFSAEEMIAAFDISDVLPNPARFDQDKATAINAEHIRRLEVGDLARRLVPYLADAGLVDVREYAELPDSQRAALDAVTPLVQTRIQVLSEIGDMAGFLFTETDAIEYDEKAVGKLADTAPAVLAAGRGALEAIDADAFTTEAIEVALRTAIVEGLEIKPRHAFGPLRVAATGRAISPPLFESLEILGKETSLERIDALTARLEGHLTRES
ncbi:Glutamyl-tRNA synthetase synthetase [Actinomycetales bacterium JB111]|nr:Glutamyl-tRNA synthetase synthetase [Actinomycetales bacterium JB111]